MIRTQVQFTEEQAKAVRRLAAEQGVSVAELVREAVDKLTGSLPHGGTEDRKKRALAAVGKFASGRGDVSKEHDRYLDEAYGR
ncbi:MAG: CopG family transcriptional regulator [Actinomycetota bacterium]